MRFPVPLRGVPTTLWAVLGVAFALALLYLAAPRAAEQTVAEPPLPLVAGWEYRWGDSPRDAQGHLVWIDQKPGAPGDESELWRPFTPPAKIAGRQGRDNLWLRIRLPAYDVPSPSLFVQTIDQVFEAYVDGERVASAGHFDAAGVGHDFPGYSWRLIRLPSPTAGKVLHLRIHSRHVNIGLGGDVLLASAYGVWAYIVQSDASRSFIAAVSFFAGCFALIVFLARPRLVSALCYAVYAIGAGVYLFARTNIRIILLADALRWNYAELSALYIFPVGIFGYLDAVFGPGWKGTARLLWRLLGAYAVVTIVGSGLGFFTMLSTLFTWQCLMMVALPLFVLNVFVLYRRGDVEARIMTFGLALGTLFSMFDLANSMGLFGRHPAGLVLAHTGSLLFTGALGAVLVRRYFEFVAAARQKARLDGELAAARTVQEALLPPPLHVEGIDLATRYAPALQTGGDWFGYHHDPESARLHVYVGDVTGHGLSSALLAGVAAGAVSAIEHTLTTSGLTKTANAEALLAMLARVCNRVIFSTRRHELEMTMAFVSLDLTTGEVVYLSAGHVPLVWVRVAEGTAAPVPNRGTRLGATSDATTPAKRFRLGAGDMLFLYTDGLVENQGPSGEQLRLRELLKLLADARSPDEARAHVVDEVTRRWGPFPPADDVTFVALRWKGPVEKRPDAPREEPPRRLSVRPR